jgi:DNA-binding response OmpR family regulator
MPQPPLILIIDDEEGARQMVASVLTNEGYAVETASNGVEGLAVLERARPSLIVLDITMPLMDGRIFARKLTEQGIKLPILVITAQPDAEQVTREIGADGYLVKPFNFFELLVAVRGLLDGKT